MQQNEGMHRSLKIKKKVSLNTVSEASYVYILSGQKFIKLTKKVNFGEFLKTWGLRSNSVIRQVTFNRTKIDEKYQQMKSSYATFWVIFKHCERADWTLKHCIIEYTSRSAVYALDFLGKKLETLVFHQHVLLPHEEAL